VDLTKPVWNLSMIHYCAQPGVAWLLYIEQCWRAKH